MPHRSACRASAAHSASLRTQANSPEGPPTSGYSCMYTVTMLLLDCVCWTKENSRL
ncbi:hypothetical protein U0070_013177 [Myodes glareolus]|uniref:Uncharacterized protein n=1 Tax=Myodes glareolus TaxID=447135 RepID=A0AAW0HJL6_MYOGA